MAFADNSVPVIAVMLKTTVIMVACTSSSPINSAIHQHRTSYTNDFNLPYQRTALFAKKPSYAGSRFNIIPDELKNLRDFLQNSGPCNLSSV
ncbi:hypothetical protein J6590_063770 [Homalodisca vitripennis]|nr:hypothetical protein J6590_063770 [Homalodisca vitripennis]